MGWQRVAEWVRARLILGRLAGVAVWLGWLLSLALGGWSHDATGHPIGADHAQYYVVGRLVKDGQAEKIYDLATMARLQAEVGGPDWNGVLPFRYPPFYALCFVWTSHLPYVASYFVWTLLSLAALLAALYALEVPHPWSWLGWALCFYPVFAAISFGQNSLFSLAIVAFSYALRRREQPFAAGLVAGLLLYKPHLLVGLGLLWLLDARRSGRILVGLAVTSLALIGLSALLIPAGWRGFVGSLAGNVQMHDPSAGIQMLSTQGFWMLLLPGQDRLVHGLSLLCSLASVVALSLLWRRCRTLTSSATALASSATALTPIAFAGAVLLTLLITPYVMVYDWALLLVPAALLWQHVPAQRPRWLVLFAALGLASFVSSPLVRAQLLLLPAALQIGVPLLVVAVLAAWSGLPSVASDEWRVTSKEDCSSLATRHSPLATP